MFEILSINNIETNDMYTMWYRFDNSIKQKVFKVGKTIVKPTDYIEYVCDHCGDTNKTILRTFNNNIHTYGNYIYLCQSCSNKKVHLSVEDKMKLNEEFKIKQNKTKTENGTRPIDIIKKTGNLGFIGQDQTKGSDIRNKMNKTKLLNDTNTNKGSKSYYKRLNTYKSFSDDKKEDIKNKQNKTKIINGTHPQQKYDRDEHFGFVNMNVEDRKKLSMYIHSILSKCDEKGISGYEYANRKRVEKMKLNGKLLRDDELTDYELYKRKVWYITSRQDLQHLSNIEKRGRADLKKDAYHLDHKVSIKYGFNNCILPYIIGDISNLECIHHSMNTSKQDKCSITIEQLTDDVVNKSGELLETP